MKRSYEKPCYFKDQCRQRNCNGSGRWIEYQRGKPIQVDCYSYVPKLEDKPEQGDLEEKLGVLACQER